MNRRQFITTAGTAAALAPLGSGCLWPGPNKPGASAQPIQGSWISVWWDDRRHFYWNDTCLRYTAAQWDQAVKDIAELGFEYLVLLAVAKGGKAFYDTTLLPKLPLACPDPIGAMHSAADKYGVKFFISSDWYGDWDDAKLLDRTLMAKRFQIMNELVTRYGKHKSFYGWYWPNEACISPYYHESFIRHVNECSAEARRLTPRAKLLTAPYGTRTAKHDDQFVRQLEKLDVDIIAYQDEVGCERMPVAESARAFEQLRRAHDRVPQRALWADVEVFAWEGTPNKQTSPLIPANFDRVLAQLEAVTPFVDKTLIYQFQGLMNRPDSPAFAGHPQSSTLYTDYRAWLAKNHPRVLKRFK